MMNLRDVFCDNLSEELFKEVIDNMQNILSNTNSKIEYIKY
jgi:hypothetical protein